MSVTARILLTVLLVVTLLVMRRGGIGRLKQGFKGLIDPTGSSSRPTHVEKTVAEKAPGLPAPEKVAAGVDRKMIDVGEREIWYLEGGAHQPIAVLLFHGFVGDKEQWLGLMSQLVAKGFHVLAPDLPGCGQNDKDPEDAYDVMSQLRHMRGFAHRVGLRSAHVIGASMGGTLAAAFAYAAKDAVRSLVLIEPFGLRVPRESELDQLLAAGRNPLIIATPAAYENLVGFLCAHPVPDRFKRERAERLAADRQVNMKIWKDVREGDRAHLLDLLLPELEVRTLVLQGDKSKVVHPATAEMIGGMMRNVQVEVIPDCGHLPMIEKLPETARHVVTFLLPDQEAP